MNRRLIFRIIFLLLLIIGAPYLFIHYDLYVFFVDKEKAISYINSFHPYDEVIFILLQVIQVIAAPIPGEVMGLIGGYLYGSVLGTIYSMVGITIGSWIAFVLARDFGRPLVEKTVRPSMIEKYDDFLKHHGLFVSFLLFLIPGFPKDCLCYIIGLSHMRTWHFLVISTVGRLLGTILLSVSGSCARNNQYTALFIIAGVSCSFILVAYFFRDKWFAMVQRKDEISKNP